MGDIVEKGSRVRVTFEAEYMGPTSRRTDDFTSLAPALVHFIHRNLKSIEVISPPPYEAGDVIRHKTTASTFILRENDFVITRRDGSVNIYGYGNGYKDIAAFNRDHDDYEKVNADG